MANYCLPRVLASKFIDELKAGKIDPDKLAEMSSAERRAFFHGIVGKDHAQHVNGLFESKLLLKDQQAGLVRWAKSLTKIPEPVRRDLLARIAKMEKVLTPSDEHGFLADLAEQRLGTGVTEDEAKKIIEMSQTATKARANPGDGMSGVSDDYLKASADLRHYVASLKPTTAMASIGRNLLDIRRSHMLMNPSTPIKTTENQALNSAIDMFTRRVSAQALRGLSRDVAKQANKEAWATFRATGRNTAGMKSLDDAGMLGEGHNFDLPEGMVPTHSALHAVEAGVRWYAGKAHKVAIDWEHNIAFTKFYQKAFFDMLNIGATNVAKAENLLPGRNSPPLTGTALKARADEIFRDASRVEPETNAGKLLRSQGQAQAERVTSTNENWLSDAALGMKNALNNSIPALHGYHLGDILMPMAKIPASVIWNGIENAGGAIPHGIMDVVQGIKKQGSEDEQTKNEGNAQLQAGMQRLVRMFGVMAVGGFFTAGLKAKDFREDPFGNGFIKVMGHWVNLEYLGALGPFISGVMSMKKYGKPRDGVLDIAGHYLGGVAKGLLHAPGVNEIHSLVTEIATTNASKGIAKYLSGQLKQAVAPAFLANAFRDRPVNRELFGASGVETQAEVNKDARERAARAAASRRANAN